MMVECPTSTPSTSVMAFHFPGLKRPSGIPSSRARTRCSTPVLYPDFFRNAIADGRPRPWIRIDGAHTRPARTGRPSGPALLDHFPDSASASGAGGGGTDAAPFPLRGFESSKGRAPVRRSRSRSL